MSDFHDPELRQQLGRLSGPYPDENEAFAMWQRRVGQARRRRAAVMLTTGAAMTAIVAVVAVAALQSPRGHSLKSGDRPQTSVSASVHVATTEKATTPVTVVSNTAGTDNKVMVGEDSTAATEATVDTTPAPTEPATSATQAPVTTAHKSGGGSDTSSSQPAQTTATTQPKAQELQKTENAVGGTVTVKLDGNRLEIVDLEAADGFDAHKNDHYRSRIDVTFTSRNHTSSITFTTFGGKIYSSVNESDTTTPGDNYGGGGAGGGGD